MEGAWKKYTTISHCHQLHLILGTPFNFPIEWNMWHTGLTGHCRLLSMLISTGCCTKQRLAQSSHQRAKKRCVLNCTLYYWSYDVKQSRKLHLNERKRVWLGPYVYKEDVNSVLVHFTELIVPPFLYALILGSVSIRDSHNKWYSNSWSKKLTFENADFIMKEKRKGGIRSYKRLKCRGTILTLQWFRIASSVTV